IKECTTASKMAACQFKVNPLREALNTKNDAIIDQNRRITIRELVDEVNISF
ncbi:Uncharacterized protein FKW44_006824, partial [Caligus rogercresseyi]